MVCPWSPVAAELRRLLMNQGHWVTMSTTAAPAGPAPASRLPALGLRPSIVPLPQPTPTSQPLGVCPLPSRPVLVPPAPPPPTFPRSALSLPSTLLPYAHMECLFPCWQIIRRSWCHSAYWCTEGMACLFGGEGCGVVLINFMVLRKDMRFEIRCSPLS